MRKNILIILILILGLYLRFNRLNTLPALNADEAAIGYNAWSLVNTGMDEHGNAWPLHFQSFNDYKPGLYFYIVLPFVKLLGLNIWVVRAPGALMGTATIILIYLLAKELRGKDVKIKILNLTLDFPTIAALFLAISPWHIHFSRGGWEVNIATFFITIGVLFLVKSAKNTRYFKYSSLFFVLGLYTYHAARIVIPLLLLGYVLSNFKYLLKNFKPILIAGIFGLVLLLPLAKDLTGEAGMSRAAGVGIFADIGPLNKINEQRGEHENVDGLVAELIHNKLVNYAIAIAENWGEHFSGDFLFISGDDIQRNKVPDHGQMYLIDSLLLIAGLYFISRGVNSKWSFMLWWLLIAPFAAALTFQSPHALRSHNMIIPLCLISAYGLTNMLNIFKQNTLLKYTLFPIMFIMLVWSFARYEYLYNFHMPRAYPYSSQYGFQEMISYVESVKDEFDYIIITDRYDQPYILTLFYLKVPTAEFQGAHVLSPRDGYGFSTVREFEKFRFNSIEWPNTPNTYPNSLIVGTDEEIPDAANIVKTIKFPNGSTAYKIVAN
ncbi:glycosyltransferase family 39 protein [Candidatus Woesebacteria bacterium]|nr:MAG: glycosyltransferase family 39 protein [Candidatus Woesebacteria bacterium]